MTATEQLGLNTVHEGVVADFLRFSRGKRSQCIRAVQSAFDTACDARLSDEETFTSEEVKEVLEGISGVVQADVEEELMASSHLTAALLQQVLGQAEQSYLTIRADLTQLEKKEILEEIAEYERQMSRESMKSSLTQRIQLEPIQGGGRDKLLQQEIERVRQENLKLQERVKMLETKVSSALSEKVVLQSKLSNGSRAAAAAPSLPSTERDEELTKLRGQVKILELELETRCTGQSANTGKSEMLQLRAELDRTKAELDKKFVETAQYKNMRQMLTSKNKQISELRSKLEQYESH